MNLQKPFSRSMVNRCSFKIFIFLSFSFSVRSAENIVYEEEEILCKILIPFCGGCTYIQTPKKQQDDEMYEEQNFVSAVYMFHNTSHIYTWTTFEWIYKKIQDKYEIITIFADLLLLLYTDIEYTHATNVVSKIGLDDLQHAVQLATCVCGPKNHRKICNCLTFRTR